MAVVLKKGGTKAKLPDSIPSSLEAGKELREHSDETDHDAAAKAVTAPCDILGVDTGTDVIQTTILVDGGEGSADSVAFCRWTLGRVWTTRHWQIC